jgi:hypothetical protein
MWALPEPSPFPALPPLGSGHDWGMVTLDLSPLDANYGRQGRSGHPYGSRGFGNRGRSSMADTVAAPRCRTATSGDQRNQGYGVNVGTYRIGYWGPHHQHEDDHNDPRPLMAV